MPKVSGIKIIRNFLFVIKKKNFYFFIIYIIIFNRGEFINIYELIKLFRQFYIFKNI